MVLGVMDNDSNIVEDACPFCASQADVHLPDWSGGKLLVRCISCGTFETNYPAIDAFKDLGDNYHTTLNWLRDQIERSPETLHITKNEHGVLWGTSSKPMTKMQKKMRGRVATGKTKVFTSTIYYATPSKKNTTQEDRDDT